MTGIKHPRDHLKIIADILKFVQANKCTKTKIMYGCCMNSKQIQSYIKFILDNELLVKSGRGYMLTEQGNRYLVLWKEMEELLVE